MKQEHSFPWIYREYSRKRGFYYRTMCYCGFNITGKYEEKLEDKIKKHIQEQWTSQPTKPSSK